MAFCYCTLDGTTRNAAAVASTAATTVTTTTTTYDLGCIKTKGTRLIDRQLTDTHQLRSAIIDSAVCLSY